MPQVKRHTRKIAPFAHVGTGKVRTVLAIRLMRDRFGSYLIETNHPLFGTILPPRGDAWGDRSMAQKSMADIKKEMEAKGYTVKVFPTNSESKWASGKPVRDKQGELVDPFDFYLYGLQK